MVDTVKKMMIPDRNFWTRASGEYETSTLHTPYRFITLMLNRIFGRENGRGFKIGWVPVIFFVAIQGTIFNWENIVSNSLSACISSALGGVSQKKTEFYMSSILIDCILYTHPFPALKCQWDKYRAAVYAAYKLFWDHKYYSHYKDICENFVMPLYTLIFMVKCNCMSEESLEVVQNNENFYLTEEGLYLRMYGGSRAPSLLPKYAKDYVIHK